MSDLISRKLLIEEIKNLTVTVIGLRAGKGILAEAMKHYKDSVIRTIEEQPSKNSERGEWLDMRGCLSWFYKCSECGNPQEYKTNFCGNCGTDMRKE